MKTGLDKTNSSYQKDINRMKNRCTELQETVRKRKIYALQAKLFIEAMLDAGKITKEDLKPYFKKRNTIK